MKPFHYITLRYERETFAFPRPPRHTEEIDSMAEEISSLVQFNLPKPVYSWNTDDGHEICANREIWFKLPTHGMEPELVLYFLAEIANTIEALNSVDSEQLSPNEILMRTTTREFVYHNNDELPSMLFISVTWEITNVL